MKSKIKFGFFFDFRNPPQWRRPWADLYAETLEFITWTESVGFGMAAVAEHHGSEDGYVPSPLVIASAIAARTKKLRIGTALAVAPFYHPVRFAEDCAVIDIVSNGRLDVAVGVGWRQAEMAAYGRSLETRGSYTEELIRIARRLWQGETVSHQSKHFNIDKAIVMPRPVQEHLPLYVGGFYPKALERAAKYADGYQGYLDVYPAYIEQVRAAGKDAATAKFTMMNIAFFVANDPEKAFAEIGPHVLYTNNAYARWQTAAEHDSQFEQQDMDGLRASGTLTIMTPTQAIAYIEEALTKASIDNFLTCPPAGMPFSKFAEHAELFAKKVIPAFR